MSAFLLHRCATWPLTHGLGRFLGGTVTLFHVAHHLVYLALGQGNRDEAVLRMRLKHGMSLQCIELVFGDLSHYAARCEEMFVGNVGAAIDANDPRLGAVVLVRRQRAVDVNLGHILDLLWPGTERCPPPRLRAA